MTSIERDSIRAEILDYLLSDPKHQLIVAQCVRRGMMHTAITPIFRDLVREGRIEVACKSIVGNAIYQAVAPRIGDVAHGQLTIAIIDAESVTVRK